MLWLCLLMLMKPMTHARVSNEQLQALEEATLTQLENFLNAEFESMKVKNTKLQAALHTSRRSSAVDEQVVIRQDNLKVMQDLKRFYTEVQALEEELTKLRLVAKKKKDITIGSRSSRGISPFVLLGGAIIIICLLSLALRVWIVQQRHQRPLLSLDVEWKESRASSETTAFQSIVEEPVFHTIHVERPVNTPLVFDSELPVVEPEPIVRVKNVVVEPEPSVRVKNVVVEEEPSVHFKKVVYALL